MHVYTGCGKGKTTAALGMIVRACGAGLTVYLGQFFKTGLFSEVRTLRKRFPEVTVEQFGLGPFVCGKPSAGDVASARRGLERLRAAMRGGKYNVVIADEINGAVCCGALSAKDLCVLIEDKPGSVELILTGRHAAPAVVKKADLVTEMKEIKHYFRKGVGWRRGFEV